jgi:hypothetical protein
LALKESNLFLEIVIFLFLGEAAKLQWRGARSTTFGVLMSPKRHGRGGAQRPVWHVNDPKMTGARSARARTRGQNPLVKHSFLATLLNPLKRNDQ